MASTVLAPASDETETMPLIEAIEATVAGTALLKAGQRGKPHFRQFTISKDLTKLTWATPKKAGGSGTIVLTTVTEVRLGQKTKVFASNRMPEHEHLSFSLICPDRTLDVICKDRRDYVIWTTALRALVSSSAPATRSEITSQLLSVSAAPRAGAAAGSLVVEVSGNKAVVQRREDASDLYTWGDGMAGRLGHGDEEQRLLPAVVEALLGKDIRALAVGAAHVCVTTPDGRLYTWGRGTGGRLGQGHERSRVTPLMVGTLRDAVVVGLAAGESHTLALTATGEVWAWGSGADSRLGFAAAKQRIPARVDALAKLAVARVVAGDTSSGVVTADGRVLTWGDGERGVLGHGALTSEPAPRVVDALTGMTVVALALGESHAAAVTADGSLYTWGEGTHGKLGHGSETDVLVPTRVSSLANVTDVTVGSLHSACLLRDGSVFTWGSSRFGQLGLGEVMGRLVPTLLPLADRIRALSAGADHVAALSVDDRLFTWGLGSSGRLGHNDENSRRVPVLVEALADKKVRTVVCGGSHTAATVVHGWVDDDEMDKCMGCKALFTFVRRRHHCRRCGGLFCGTCSAKKFPLISMGFSEAVRVCDKCHSIVSAE